MVPSERVFPVFERLKILKSQTSPFSASFGGFSCAGKCLIGITDGTFAMSDTHGDGTDLFPRRGIRRVYGRIVATPNKDEKEQQPSTGIIRLMPTIANSRRTKRRGKH